MKNFGLIGIAMAALVLAGCSSSNKSGSMGAVNADKGTCEKQGACCSEGQKKDAAMGAVSEKKAGCCASQGTCTGGAKAN